MSGCVLLGGLLVDGCEMSIMGFANQQRCRRMKAPNTPCGRQLQTMANNLPRGAFPDVCRRWLVGEFQSFACRSSRSSRPEVAEIEGGHHEMKWPGYHHLSPRER